MMQIDEQVLNKLVAAAEKQVDQDQRDHERAYDMGLTSLDKPSPIKDKNKNYNKWMRLLAVSTAHTRYKNALYNLEYEIKRTGYK